MMGLEFKDDKCQILRDGVIIAEVTQSELDEIRALIVEDSGEE